MLAPNDQGMTLSRLFQVLFHRKKEALLSFGILLFFSLIGALFLPLKYESQVVLERKPVKISSQASSQLEEFDISRLTSEIQRNVALLKSRATTESWADAIGLSFKTPLEKAKQIKRLNRSLTVQPINYTDIFVLKVRAKSPEEANRRAGLLADLYTEWDAKQNREEAQELIRLLQYRQEQNRKNLAEKLTKLKRYKSGQSVSLSGSNTEKELEADIAAQSKLYDMLSIEMEEAERRLGDSARRVRVIAPPKALGEPVQSRFRLIILACCTSWLLALLLVLLWEWHDRKVREADDILHIFPSHPVVSIPRFSDSLALEKEMGAFLEPVRDAVIEVLTGKGSAIVQVVSSDKGDGKTTFCQALARLLRSETKVCILRRSSGRSSDGATDPVSDADGIATLEIDPAFSVKKHLTELQKRYGVFLLDKDTVGENFSGSEAGKISDIICVLIVAGQTHFSFLNFLSWQFKHSTDQKVIFVLNQFINPLPKWLRH